MRRTLVLALTALALLGVVTPDAYAQMPAAAPGAPTPTFKITGFIDELGTYSRNVSVGDGDLHRIDTTFYGRTRGRFDIIGEYGKAKAVLGLELDFAYGQTGSGNSNIATVQGGAVTAPTGAVFAPFGTDGSLSINTDVRGILEIKWLYTEFELPFIPVPTVVRLGAQPFGSAASYKLATYANGDFAGVNVVSTVTPNVKAVASFVSVEENMFGRQCGFATSTCFGVNRFQLRGDDWAVIFAPEITPVKGLDIKPMYSYFTASGTTNGNARQGHGGISATTWFQNSAGLAAPNDDGSWRKGINEDRHTVGIDGRFRMGPFSLDPSVLYQFGNRSVVAPTLGSGNFPVEFLAAGVVPGRKYTADIDAWLIDIRGGFQLGPLLLEAMYMYTTGQSARNTTLGKVHYWTPALSMYGGANVHFTDTAIQKNATPGANGLIPVFTGPQATKAFQYLGTELFGGVTWRFAPGIAWDNAGGYMFMGPGMDALTNPATGPRDARDSYIVTSRLRFSF